MAAVEIGTTNGLWLRPPVATPNRVQDAAGPNPVSRLLSLLQGALDAGPDATLIADGQGRLAYANEEARRLFSLAAFPTESAVEPDATLGLCHADGRPIPQQGLPFARVLRGEVVVDLPLLVCGPTIKRSVVCTAGIIRDIQGTSIGAIAAFREKADDGRVEGAEARLPAELDTEFSLSEEALATAPIGIAFLEGNDLLVTWANEEFHQLLGESRYAREIVGQPLAEVIPNAEASSLVSLLRRGSASGRPFVQREHEHQSPSREPAYWRWTAVPLSAEGGGAPVLLLMIVDITAQTLARLRPRATPSQAAATPAVVPMAPDAPDGQALQAVLDSLSDGCILVDRRGAILHMNPSARLCHGLQGKTATPQTCEQLAAVCQLFALDGSPLPPDKWPLARALRGESFSDLQTQVRRADAGARCVLRYDGKPVHDPHSQMALALVTVREVLPQMEAKWLRDKYAELVSQQLRTPLAAVTSMADWLHHRLTEHQLDREANASGHILEAAKRMSSLTKDLAEASWLESGNGERRKVPASLLQLISAVAKRRDAEHERPRIRLECPDWIPPVSVNPERIERAVAALLDRALQVSPPGTQIGVRLTHRAGEAIVTVVDQGAPVPSDRVPGMFKGAGAGRASDEETTLALVLYIARLTVESHSGRIWVDSEEKQGCAISFSLPTLF